RPTCCSRGSLVCRSLLDSTPSPARPCDSALNRGMTRGLSLWLGLHQRKKRGWTARAFPRINVLILDCEDMGQTTEDFGSPLEQFREYLNLLARVQVRSELRGQLDASDLVQQTLLKAHGNRDQFRGTTDAERAGWLRAILA